MALIRSCGIKAVQIAQRQAPFHRTLDTDQTDTELVLGHFTDGTNTTVTQVVDIVHFIVTVTDVDQALHDLDDIVLGQHANASLSSRPRRRLNFIRPTVDRS